MNNENRRDFLSKMMVAGAAGMGLMTTSAFAGKKTTTTLTDVQKDMLFYIYQEEKVARDVYITLGNLYEDENTFAWIQISEQRHMDAARDLCVKYGIDVSGVDESVVGEFVLTPLQELYETCVGKGEESLLDGLKIGELIEVTDIEDLEKASEGMPSDVVLVYESLKEGSLNHLEAFQTAIAREG